jgi:hypothetical protein
LGISSLRFSVALATMLGFTTHATAEPVLGVWSSQYGCDWLEQNAHNTDLAIEDSRIYSIGYLDNTGVNGVNWGCSFNSIVTDNSGTFTADSNCWMETKFWKQNIAVTKNAETWVVVIHEDHDEKIYLVFDTQCVASIAER